MKLLYVSDSFINSTVFASQVHTLCNYHAADCEVNLLCLCDKEEILAEKFADSNYDFFKTPRLPLTFTPLLNIATAWLFRDYFLFICADVIHCRGPIAAAFAIRICKSLKLTKPIIADMRGVMAEEIAQSGRKLAFLFAKMAKQLEEYVFAHAEYFFFVSENMREYYSKLYPGVKERNAVFPTIVDESFFYQSEDIRREKRQELKIRNEKVYVYCGGVSYWQNVDKIIEQFHAAWMENNDMFLLMIVKEQAAVVKMMSELNISNPNILLRSLPYKEVGQYLNAADYGVIIRDDIIVNHVASPTKINEYLACGLTIIDKLQEIGQGANITHKKYHYTFLADILRGQKYVYHYLCGSVK